MSSPKSIYAYRLADPEPLASKSEALAAILFGEDASGPETYFHVSPLTGSILYKDHAALWRNRAPGAVSKESGSAERTARHFFEISARNLAQSTLSRGRDRIPSLFPQRLELAGTQLMLGTPEDDGALLPAPMDPDHWVCTFLAYLPTGGIYEHASANTEATPLRPPSISVIEPDAPVANGTFEVRVGAGGRIVGFLSRWRPIESCVIVPRLPPPEEGDDGPTTPHDSAVSRHRLFYWMAGEDVPQTILGPYYNVVPMEEDHAHQHSGIWPASSYSLQTGILERPMSDGAMLQAVVEGNSGDLEYSWGTLRLDEESTFETLGSGPELRVSSGVHNIVLDVLDRSTGAFTRTQRVVVVRDNSEVA